MVNAEVAARTALEAAAVAAATKWAVAKELGFEGQEPQLTIEVYLTAALNKITCQGSFDAVFPAPERKAAESIFAQRIQALKSELCSGPGLATVRADAEPRVAVLMEALKQVVEPNMERLLNHLDGMRDDHAQAAVRDIPVIRNCRILKSKAGNIHKVLVGAMDDVEAQFVEAIRSVAAPQLLELTRPTVMELVISSVRSSRAAIDARYALPILEALLDDLLSQRIDANRLLKSASKGTDPLGWLLGISMGVIQLDLPCDVADFLCVATARYLDPFIDGEVPAAQYDVESEGPFFARLAKEWQATHGDEQVLPPGLSPEMALAAYYRHALTKMNMQLGWGAHIPGLGRQPASALEQERHLKQLGVAIVAAIERDFAPEHRSIGSLSAITVNHVIDMGQLHLQGIYAYHHALAEALASANRDGEEARRQERLCIWGYA